MPRSAIQQEAYLLIAAAGSGSRFGSDMPKQYCFLRGKTVLRHTIERFLDIIPPGRIRVIIDPDHAEWYQESVRGLEIADPAYGSNSRKESVYNGLKSFSNLRNQDIILIHDAARPFVDTADLKALLEAMRSSHAATLAHPITDTLIRTDTNDYPDRAILRAIQTPQAFRYETILRAHNHFVGQDHFTDDSSLVSATGETVEFVTGSKNNFKITTQDDFKMAEQIMAYNTVVRTGIGFDVHAFDENSANTQNIRLGGIDIPFPRKLKGHSDADVALHTITDALLGAVAAGDIGDHFPPSDKAYKNMDSGIFLKKAGDIIQERGGEIINIDLVIICEEPKIGPHKDAIQKRVAEILDIAPDKISIKATTTEQLGFTGRKEGIAAQAVANVEVPR